MSASPNATRGSSPQRLRHQGSQRNDDHSSASPIGRKARISPTAVKSREEYSACARELRARTLGDYRNEEPQQQQEQGGGKPQAEHPPAGHRTAGQGERRQTQATKKAEHAGNDNHVHYFFSMFTSARFDIICTDADGFVLACVRWAWVHYACESDHSDRPSVSRSWT
jgi:hypothetical protein